MMRGLRSPLSRLCVRLCLLLCVLLLAGRAGLQVASVHAQGQPACSRQQSAAGLDFRNKDLSGMNFSGRDLRMADFSGSTLRGTVFIGADLSGADFSGAVVQKSEREDLRPTDFTGARLAHACLAGMTFKGRSYFTYAELGCADFSRNDFSSGLAIFGPSPLKIDPAAGCKPAFRGTVMHCEFVPDWPRLDLGAGNGSGGADLSACARDLAGLRLDGAILDGVNLRGAVLDGASLAGASLKEARLDNASLQCSAQQCADLHNANLQGATLVGANLSGANLHQAVLTGEAGKPAADLSFAHLRNVNLSFAQLTGANFSGANFYGTYAGQCNTSAPGRNGHTLSCATAYGATMTGTLLTNAYLYGVDFGAAAITGAHFDGAVLVAADFSGASIGTSSNNVRTTFNGAWLQGTNLDRAASLRDADLSNAALDFRPRGNQLYLALPGRAYNRHACGAPGCKPPAQADVCVWLAYGQTTVPAANAGIVCPDGFPAGAGCGRPQADGGNPRWNGGQPAASLQAWYADAATYAPAAAPAAVCNGRGAGAAITNW